MLLNETFETDTSSEVEGVWVDFGDDAEVRIARFGNDRYLKLDRELKKPFRRRMRQGRDIPEKKLEAIMLQLLVKTIVRDWKNIQVVFDEQLKAKGLDVDNKAKVNDIVTVPYSIKNAFIIFGDKRFGDFKEECLQISMTQELYRQGDDDDAEKNSASA